MSTFKFIIGLALSIFIIGCSDSPQNRELYFPITKTIDNVERPLYGFINSKGDVIDPVFAKAADFYDLIGLGIVEDSESGLYGYIDKKGKYVILPKFDDAKFHSREEGLARVKENGLWGYIDTKGNYVIPPQFEFAGSFSEGLAFVQFGTNYGYIDVKGKFAIQPNLIYESIGKIFGNEEKATNALFRFNNNRAAIYVNNKFGCIDKSGKVVIPAIFDVISPFYEGKAKVGVCQNCDKEIKEMGEMDLLQGIIDTLGRYIIKPKFINIGHYNNGLAPAAVKRENNISDVIPNEKNILNLKLFGPAVHSLGYIDLRGNWVIEPKFDYIDNEDIDKYRFSEDLAFVCINDTCGYIDKHGDYKIERSFFRAGSLYSDEAFSGGLASVSIKPGASEILLTTQNYSTGKSFIKKEDFNYIGYINKKGEFVIYPKFRTASPFRKGVAMVTGYQDCYQDCSCYIDTTGKYIWYDEKSKPDFDVID